MVFTLWEEMMANKVRFLIFTVFLIVLSATVSNATIIFQGEESVSVASEIPFLQATVQSPNGLVGDFEVLACANIDEGVLDFNVATPGWTEENQGKCGIETCVMSINSKFSDSTGGELNTCSWDALSPLFVGGILRYSGVDTNNPIIDLQCSADVGPTATAPSVITEANSVVLRFFISDLPIDPIPIFALGRITPEASINADLIALTALGQVFTDGGPTGTLDAGLSDTAPWRACTMALRMEGGVAEVPTISEWGLIATAAILGMIAFIAIRRKKALA